MRTFNNSDLFTGYLKQLLHDFNLPKIKVYTKQHQQYAAQYGVERPDILDTIEASVDNKAYSKAVADTIPSNAQKNVRYFPYIKDGQIQEYVNSKWQNIRTNDIKPMALSRYNYGVPILNYTKNLKINSNTYDSYTHEYLGDYLRFHRDFLNLDLMPLYNCFSNRACDKLTLHWKLKAGNTQFNVSFDSSDPNFKIYMLPVKLFQKYTIAIDSNLPIELCCGIYGDYQDTREKFATLPSHTYRRLPTSVFSQPFLYDALAYTDEDTTVGYIDRILDAKVADRSTLIELAQNECDLKLFIKVPVQNDSTIVVLEGDYCNWNGAFWDGSITAGLATTQDNTQGLSVYLEFAGNGDGCYPYIVNYNSKIYLNLELEHNQPKLVYKSAPDPNVIFQYDSNLQTILTTLSNGRTYVFGTRRDKNYTSIIPVDTTKTPFVCKFYDSITGELVTEPQLDTGYKFGLINTNADKQAIHYLTNGTALSQDKKRWNKSIINLENLTLYRDHSMPLITSLQLLQFNTREQHPFADRLVEYLIGNAITIAETEISDNIKRAQKALSLNSSANNYQKGLPGVWSNAMRILFYEYMVSGASPLTNQFDINHDILGYVDKDVEKFYQATVPSNAVHPETISLSSIELEEGDK